MALTSAQLDEHTNRLYIVVTFLIRILEAHDYTPAQEQLSSELVSALFQRHSVVLASNSHSISEHTLKSGVFNNTPKCVLVHTKVCTTAHKGV